MTPAAPTTIRFGIELEVTASSLHLNGARGLLDHVRPMDDRAASHELLKLVRQRLAMCQIDVTGAVRLKEVKR